MTMTSKKAAGKKAAGKKNVRLRDLPRPGQGRAELADEQARKVKGGRSSFQDLHFTTG
jgi:hypothetical protein